MKDHCHIECFKTIAQFVKDNSSETTWFDSSVATTGIICVTLIAIILIIRCTINGNDKQHDKKSDINVPKEEVADNKKEKETENKKEESASEKEREYFLNFCYEMIRSKDENNRHIKEDCWKYLCNTFVADDKIKEVPQNVTDNDNSHEG